MTRTEYGAQVVSPAMNVYVKAFTKAVVVAWIAEYGSVTPVRLVSRQCVGDLCGAWGVAG